MIYVSSSCIKKARIKDSIEELATNGFNNIELSGGTEYYHNLEADLLSLKDKYNLNYLCHNYFPPPKKHFVLNLASLDDDIFNNSINFLRGSISLCKRLGSDKYGFHAGFFINIKVNEIGGSISKDSLFNQKESINRFCGAFKLLQNEFNGIDLYVENNVFSKTNWINYNGENPFMMTSYKEYQLLREQIDFNLLLDVAHLKVSSKTLNLNWESEFYNMMCHSDYIHISDNDGLHDLNNRVDNSVDLLQLLEESDTENKTFTLEVYGDIDSIKKSYNSLKLVI